MGYKEEKQHQLDMRYLRMARIWAENSYCVRRKVGALIVKDKMIISDGYNGTPAGFENICEDETGKTKSYVLHAEANAITKVAKSANNCDGSTLYITAAPCIECSRSCSTGKDCIMAPTGGLQRRLPLRRGTRPAAPGRYRMRTDSRRRVAARNSADTNLLSANKSRGAYSTLPSIFYKIPSTTYLIRANDESR